MKMKYDCMIHHKLINTNLIKGPVVDLKLLGFYERDLTEEIPFYCFQIMHANQAIGKITLRLGYNEYTMIHGHVGYGIDSPYRGHNYSFYALEMIKELAREHGYRKLVLTTDSKNEQSKKTVLKSSGTLIESEKIIPHDHIYFVLGIETINVYEISL